MNGDPPGVQHLDGLRRSLACLAQARRMLKKAGWSEVPEIDAVGDQAAMVTDAARAEALERMRVVRGSLEEMLALAESTGVSERVEVMLKQHDRAVAACGEAEKEVRSEALQVKDLKAHVAELGRRLDHGSTEKRRLREKLQGERRLVLERRRAAAEEAVAGLEQEARDIEAQLETSLADNREADELVDRLEREHIIATQENLLARRALGEHASLEYYRRTKFQERSEADETLARAVHECEVETARLEAAWAEQQARHRQDLQELLAEVEVYQGLLAEKTAETEGALAQQAAQSQRAVREVERQTIAEARQLKERREHKDMLLRKQVADTQQMMKETSAGTQRQLTLLLDESRLAYRTRARFEETKCETAIKAQHQSVEVARKERQDWERRAELTRENYRGHVIKSGSYVKSLDPESRRELMSIWTEG